MIIMLELLKKHSFLIMVYPLAIATILEFSYLPKWLTIIFYLFSFVGAIGVVITGLTKK